MVNEINTFINQAREKNLSNEEIRAKNISCRLER